MTAIRRIKSASAIKRWLRRPEIQEAAGRKWNAEDLEWFGRLARSPRNWFVVAERDGVSGFYCFFGVGSGDVYEAHAVTERGNWGKAWVRLSREVVKWFVKESGAGKVVTFTKGREGAAFVRSCGLRRMDRAGNRFEWKVKE